MKLSIRTRSLVLAVAAGGLLTMPLALPASAAQSASCKSVTSPPLKNGGASSTFSNCSPTALKAGGTGVSPKTPPIGAKKGSLNLVITWKAGGKTTVTLSVTAQTPGNCKAGTVRFKATGKVLSSTGAAGKVIKKNEPVSASTCVVTSPKSKAGASSLEPGTSYKM